MRTGRLLLRRIRASWRDTLLLFREFRLALAFFVFAIIGCSGLYWRLSLAAGKDPGSFPRVIYHILTLTFLQPTEPFPEEWFLQFFYFTMPVIGIAILAQGLADFGIMLFNRRARGKEWEMAIASTLNRHIILVGLGHLGFRVVKELRSLNQDVVVIEISPKQDLVDSVHQMDTPVIIDDGTRETVLALAGTERARAIILCTQDDSLNLRMALKARSLNPKIEVIIRIFDDEFATSLENQFGFHAMSATGMAAPLFASIAAQIDITPPIMIEGNPHILANLHVDQSSKLLGKTVLDIEERFGISIVMMCKNSQHQFHPPAQEYLQSGCTITIFGAPEKINQLLYENLR